MHAHSRTHICALTEIHANTCSHTIALANPLYRVARLPQKQFTASGKEIVADAVERVRDGTALSNVSFSVPRGSVCAIVGMRVCLRVK